MERTLIIRVDCNPIIASGHLMRCISIAREAKKNDINIIFLMSDSNSFSFLRSMEFDCISLNSNWRDINGELIRIKGVIERFSNPVLLVDTYSVNSQYISELTKILPVVYLGSKTEDLGIPTGIINYSSDIDFEWYHRSFPKTDLLLGVKYAPLREEFKYLQDTKTEKVRNILVTTGNTDNNHFTSKFLKACSKKTFSKDILFTVVVGKMYNNIEELKSINIQNGLIDLQFNVVDMAALMKSCQLAVSANGTTVYELAACHIPTISFALVEEQIRSGRALSDLGVVDYCGFFQEDEDECIDKIINKINMYVTSEKARYNLGHNAGTIIDGDGSNRIVNYLTTLFK